MKEKKYNIVPSLFLLFVLILIQPFTHAAVAETAVSKSFSTLEASSPEDEAELRRLLAVLEKHTDIATQSKLNADYVPGMVTVLRGEDLQARGIRNVWEALGLIPGIQLSEGANSDRSASVRGLGETFGSGSVKFMVNGIPVNVAFTALNFAALEIPVEQVEQIEVIRGPGSALHGEYAYTGVVNIITRSEGNRIFGGVGRYESYEGGGLLSWSDPDQDLHVSLNLAGCQTDGADTRSGLDVLYRIGQGAISNSPGPANDDREVFSSIMGVSYKDFSFQSLYLKSGHGDHFGIRNALPRNKDEIVIEDESWLFELNQRLNFSSSFWADVNLGYMESDQTVSGLMIFPPGFVSPPAPPAPSYLYVDGMIAGLNYSESRIHGKIGLTWEGWNRHRIFTEVSMAKTSMGDNIRQKTNYLPSTLAPLPSMRYFDGAENFIKEDQDRFVNSLVLQDEFSVSQAFDLTFGLRFDHYDDTDDSITPRAAGVWRISETHMVKVQYARAFRPPSFVEMYVQNSPLVGGNEQIEPQTSDNYELGYIYRGKGGVGRVTLFQTDLDDLIVVEGIHYANSDGARLRGCELELEQALFLFLKMDTNISYSDTEDKDTGREIAGTANWLANFGILYEPYEDLALNAQYRYVGKQNRAPTDVRDKLDAAHTVDITGSLFNLGFRDLTLRAGIKNLFSEDLSYAAPQNTYPEDYPQPGRWWWLRISYDF